MNYAAAHDIGTWLGHAPGFNQVAITAGGSGDATEVDGKAFDRMAQGNRFASVCAIVQIEGTLASGETATIAANFQDSPNNSDWTDHGTAVAATTVLNAAGGAISAKAATIKIEADLADAQRYVRLQATPNLSRAGTDTAVMSAVLVFGGPDLAPAGAVSAREP